MPPLPVVPSTIRFTLTYSWGGNSNVLNRFFMKYTNPPSAADLTTLTTKIGTSWATRMAPLVPGALTLLEVGGDDLGSKTGANIVTSVDHNGTDSGSSLTCGAACIQSASVSFKYRGGHPRVYLPALSQTHLADANTWSVPAIGLVGTAWTGILSDLASSPPVGVGALSQVAVHAYSSNPQDFPGGHPTTPPPWPLATPVTYPINGWSTNPQVGSQRRRNQQ